MIEFLQWVGAVGGIGAVFAILMFFVLMKVMKIMREDRKYMEDRMKDYLDAYNIVVKESTKTLSELFAWLKAKNGKR